MNTRTKRTGETCMRIITWVPKNLEIVLRYLQLLLEILFFMHKRKLSKFKLPLQTLVLKMSYLALMKA